MSDTAPNRDSVVTLATAAKWLGGRRSAAVAWISANVPTFPHPVTGDRSVVWGRVLQKIEQIEDRAEAASSSGWRNLPTERL
jgi:predicted DNA-binding transcriptional regulator AlpA